MLERCYNVLSEEYEISEEDIELFEHDEEEINNEGVFFRFSVNEETKMVNFEVIDKSELFYLPEFLFVELLNNIIDYFDLQENEVNDCE